MVGEKVISNGSKVFVTARHYGENKRLVVHSGGKVETVETREEVLVRETEEELDSKILVGKYLDTIENDYPEFNLSVSCYWCSLISGELTLKKVEDAKGLTRESIDSVKWLPVDITI